MNAFVTCIYNGLYHTEFGGRNMRDARYRESLINIANTGAKIFCFTSTKNLPILKNDFSRCPNITLIVKDLERLDISPIIQEIKRNNKEKYSDLFWTQRCVEIMWGKFYMIKDILDEYPEYSKVYWIDAGLFHNDVISPKYFLDNKPALENSGLPLFNKFFMKKLDVYSSDKIILAQQTNPHNRPIDEKYNKRPYQTSFGAVGGFFGGDSTKMKIVCDSFIEKIHMLLKDQELCSEEGILSAICADYPEFIKPFIFQSWYHEGWGERHDPKLITFSNMFDKILEHDDIEHGVVMCTLSVGERFRNYTKDLLIKSFLEKVEDKINLVVFTDDVKSFSDYGPRVHFKQIDANTGDTVFRYGLKYKVVEETHRMFDKLDTIFYLDADCYFAGSVAIADFDEALPGINISLGNPSSAVINPQIITKYKMITNHVMQTLPSGKEITPTHQFRECAMIFKINDKYTFNKFLGEWQILYEFCLANKLAFSGEYVEITYALIRSGYPLVNTSGTGFFKTLRNHVHTIILNKPTQAMF